MKEKTARILCICLVILIFLLSQQSAKESTVLSNRVASAINLEKDNTQADISFQPLLLGLNIRKYAHMGLYFILGVLSFKATCAEAKLRCRFIEAMVVCTFAAIFDEIHQLFVPGRTGRIVDVGIDAIGFGIAIIICIIISMIWHSIPGTSE